MAKNVDPIIVKIQAEFNEFKKDLDSAKADIKGFSKESVEAGNKAEASFKKMKVGMTAVAAAATAAGAAIAVMTKSVLDNVKEQKLWAQRLSISSVEFGKLTAIARRFGAETDDVGDAIKDLNERIADAARGNKTYEDALKMVGLASKDLINLPIEQQFIRVADAIGKMKNAGDQNFATAELMADAGFRLLEVFRLGEDGIRKMGEEVMRTNEAMDAFELAKLEDVAKGVKSLDAAYGALANTISIRLAPGIDMVTKSLQGWNDILSTNGEAELGSLSKEYAELNKRFSEIESTLKSIDQGNFSSVWDLFGGDRGKDAKAELDEELIDLMVKLRSLEKQMKAIGESATDPLVAGMEAYQKMKVSGPSEDDRPVQGAEMGGDLMGSFPSPFMSEEAYASSMDSLNNWMQEALDATEKHEMSIVDIKRRSVEAQNKLEQFKSKFQINEVQSSLRLISSLMSSESRKMFEIGKVAAIADATINTYKGANVALGSAPPPFNFALAAGVVAAGVANIQKIASTQMGGGGAPSVGGGAGGAFSTGGQGAPVQENVIDASFNIQSDSGMVSSDQLRAIASGLNELTEDGAKIRSVRVI